MHYHLIKELFRLQIFSLFLGIISLFAIGIEKVMYDEVGHEIFIEWPAPGEVSFLYLCLGINALFCLVMIFLIYKTLALFPIHGNEIKTKDEKIFNLAQVMGIISGLMGMLLTFFVIARQTPTNKFWIFVPFYFLFFIPYALVAGYWLIMKSKEKISDWYDEKQWKDILRSSLTTLILSIPGLSLLLFVREPIHFYWFPYYISFVLLIFSSSTLYFFKYEDEEL